MFYLTDTDYLPENKDMTEPYIETQSYRIYRSDGFVLKRIIGAGYDIFAPSGAFCAFAETTEQVEEKIRREKYEFLCGRN